MRSSLLLLVCCGLSCLAVATDNRIVCYFINWAWYRDAAGKFLPEDLDADMCSHINFAFAILDPNTLTLKSSDPWADIDNKFYQRINALKSKNPNLKVLISLGGWTDSAGNKYSRLVSNPSSRLNFNQKVIEFLTEHKFDGLDIDWEYPKCWQGDCNAGPASDKQNFAAWIRELRQAFDQQNPRLLLTSAVVAGGSTVDEGYDLKAMAETMNFINIMTYDFHNYMDGKTGHHAQRERRPSDGPKDANTVDSLNKWHSGGIPKNKLVLGLPAYGRSFTLSNPGNNGLDAPTNGPGTAGEITKEGGFLGFLEICNRQRQGWSKGRDATVGSWIYSGNQWVGYDDLRDTVTKAKYARDNGYGGVMVWDVTMDDFKGTCCSTKFPFLKAMNYGLLGKGSDPSSYGCP